MSGAQLKSNVWRCIKHYSYGCFAKSWNGAIAGVYGFVGIATGSALDPQKIQVPNWQMIAYIFLVSFAISALGFFKDNPLPPKLELESQPPFVPPKP